MQWVGALNSYFTLFPIHSSTRWVRLIEQSRDLRHCRHVRENSIKPLTRNGGDIKVHELHELHKMLRELEQDNDADEGNVERIKDKIRASLPSVNTGRTLPQKKTPSGRTQVLHMNYTRSQTNTPVETELEHLRFFARTATELGLRLEILTHENNRKDIETELEKDIDEGLDYIITASQKSVSKWAEDSVEYLENGTVAVLTPVNDTLLEWAMTEGRRHRWQGKVAQETLEEALREDHLWIPLGIRVNASETGIERERTAQEKRHDVGHIRAYIEGGNMITGEDSTGRPVILIGKDAIETTAYLYQLDDDSVRRVICEDFGLEHIDQIICVEQPGQFHLDMGMLFIGNGVVIVNDSSKALKDAVEMAELVPCMTTETMAAKLTLQYELETSAVSDLKAAGLTVIRETLENGVFYNFFNGEFATGVDGLNYYITNGGPHEQEERFKTLMADEWNVVENVFFSPQSAAHKSLQEKGGIGCRLKGAPE